jgi:hypothetical protein
MTNREFFTNISNGVITELEIEHAKTALVKMDETNAKRKAKAAESTEPTKKALENAPLIDEAYTVLGTETKTAADVAAAMAINPQKASYLLRELVKQGRATVEDIKAPKKGTVKAYTAVIAE